MPPPVNRQSHSPDIGTSGNNNQSDKPDQPRDSSQPNIVGSEKIGLFIWLFLLFMLAGYAYRISRSDAYADFQEVLIPATSLMGGAEVIGPGEWLSIARYSGGTNGTPSAEEWRMLGRVSAVSGNETEKKLIILAVPTNQAPTLQAALAVKDGAPLVYVPGPSPTATPSPDPSASATATATSTGTPTPFIAPPTRSGQVGLEIPIERIDSGSAIDQQSLLSLVIVPKVVSGSEDEISSAPPLFSGCATFANFLNKDRRVPDKAADATTVVVWLAASRLPEAAAALTHAERVYLVPDASCEF